MVGAGVWVVEACGAFEVLGLVLWAQVGAGIWVGEPRGAFEVLGGGTAPDAVEEVETVEALGVGAGVWVVEARGAFEAQGGGVLRPATAAGSEAGGVGELGVGAGDLAGAVRLLESAAAVEWSGAGTALVEANKCLGDGRPYLPCGRNGSSRACVGGWLPVGTAEGIRAGIGSGGRLLGWSRVLPILWVPVI